VCGTVTKGMPGNAKPGRAPLAALAIPDRVPRYGVAAGSRDGRQVQVAPGVQEHIPVCARISDLRRDEIDVPARAGDQRAAGASHGKAADPVDCRPAGAITFKAGSDINLRAASVDAGKDLTAIAGSNLNILAGVDTSQFDRTSQTTKSGFLHHETITTRNTLDATSAIGSVLGGTTVNLSAGQDLKVVGSSVVGDKDVNLVAKNAFSIEAATNQSRETHYLNVKESGLLSGGSFGISFGTRTTTTNQDQDASIQSGLARSTVGSIGGNLNVSAGEAPKIVGSDLSAGKDMNLAGKSVAITPGVDDVNGKFTTKMTQDALTLAIGGSVVNAIQTAQTMGAAAGQTSSGRLKALAAASATLTAKDAAQDLAKNGPSVKISLTVGHSESESTEVTASSTHGGSVLAAGNDITLGASGDGKASNLDIVGSDLHAKGSVSLAAENQVNLLAAQDTESQHSQSKSWSAFARGSDYRVGRSGRCRHRRHCWGGDGG
jgi:filamentous hemagglutinin